MKRNGKIVHVRLSLLHLPLQALYLNHCPPSLTSKSYHLLPLILRYKLHWYLRKMSGAARFLPACSNLVIFIISLPILAIGILLRYYVVHTTCTNYLLGPLLALGIGSSFMWHPSYGWLVPVVEPHPCCVCISVWRSY